MSTSYPSDLIDAEWECVQRYLPAPSRRGRPRTHPLRRILDAIFYVLRTGCQWRYLPTNFPPWQTVFYHFRRFRIKNTLHALYRPCIGPNGSASAAIPTRARPSWTARA
jgi:putative transposase